ncbi:sentrin-specific protease 2-like isoform X3 [Apteryx mantelli]|uniref:Sentrin-specific protease 2-like isoform X3 n=1 Tax=Apteryx mantelli TaxID=2696672 RepID=A0ABM4EZV2_9AVES
MKANFERLGPVKGTQSLRSLSVVAKHCSACSFLSVQSPVEDPDQTPAKKRKSDYAVRKPKERVEKVPAVVKFPAKAADKHRKASVSNAAPSAESAEETQSTASDNLSNRPAGCAQDLEMLQVDKMPCGSNTRLNKAALSLSHKTIPCLSASRNGKHRIKPTLEDALTLRPPIREHTMLESTTSESGKTGRPFCTAEEDVQRGEKEKCKGLLKLVKEKYPRSCPIPQSTNFCNAQASSKEPVTSASRLEEQRRGEDIYQCMTLKTSIKCADACGPQWLQKNDMIRYYTAAENSHEQGRPVKQASAGRQRGAEISEEVSFRLRLAPVLSRKSSALDVEEKKFPSSEKRVEGLSPLTEAMEREVTAAFNEGEPNETMSSAFKLKVTREDIHTLRNLHWLNDEVIDVRRKSIKYFDSVGQKGDKICETLIRYLQEESKEKRNLELSLSEWILRSMESHEIPQQLNGSDCGVFMCKYADYISRDKPITFTQNNMPYFRRKMVWEIIHQQLL